MYKTREQILYEKRHQDDFRDLCDEVFGSDPEEDQDPRIGLSDDEYLNYLIHETTNYCDSFM